MAINREWWRAVTVSICSRPDTSEEEQSGKTRGHQQRMVEGGDVSECSRPGTSEQPVHNKVISGSPSGQGHLWRGLNPRQKGASPCRSQGVLAINCATRVPQF
ncbi:hypothetical protein PoB_006796300 [Plakobranchus ocellatus]|uniref:Uncharacterized protein n=1 Tax=Plakobranchus ocellatus TaxID=259542 RepID=A0AAV4DB21_9GAST|nr:hypothetical protein PoB_006796300 [Plakobranchus ocellatus]